jgi:hypothetical protein
MRAKEEFPKMQQQTIGALNLCPLQWRRARRMKTDDGYWAPSADSLIMQNSRMRKDYTSCNGIDLTVVSWNLWSWASWLIRLETTEDGFMKMRDLCVIAPCCVVELTDVSEMRTASIALMMEEVCTKSTPFQSGFNEAFVHFTPVSCSGKVSQEVAS